MKALRQGRDPTGTSEPTTGQEELFLVEIQNKRNGLLTAYRTAVPGGSSARTSGHYWEKNHLWTPNHTDMVSGDESKFNSAYLQSCIDAMPWGNFNLPAGTTSYGSTNSSLTNIYQGVASGFLETPGSASNTTLYAGRMEQVRFRVSATSKDHPPLHDKFLKITRSGPFEYYGGTDDLEVDEVVPFSLDLPTGSLTTEWIELKANHTDGQDTRISLLPVVFKTYPDSEPGPDKAHKLNLDTRQNEKASYGQGWEKCVSKVWATANTVNLIDYLDGGPSNHSVYENAVKWKVNGTAQSSPELSLGNEPGDDSHRHYYVEVQPKNGGDTIDRLIITLVPRSTKSRFDSWYTTENVDLVWLGELVNLFYSISIVPLPDGYMRRPCRNFNPFLYAVPSATNTRMHPDAYYETRSYATPGGHAHQMCFDDSGILLQVGVSAGSADKAAAFPQNFNPFLHVEADVKPFIWALQLDGTPADQQTTTLSAPIMHEGAYLKKYAECRPAIANSKPILADGATP